MKNTSSAEHSINVIKFLFIINEIKIVTCSAYSVNYIIMVPFLEKQYEALHSLF